MRPPEKTDWIKVFFDGSSLGNPGPAGVGVVVLNGRGRLIFSGNRFLGKRTNNEAEYFALLFALEISRELGYKKILLHTDSTLLYSQVVGKYKVRAENLKKLHERAVKALSSFTWDMRWVPREENKKADKLAQKAAKIGGFNDEKDNC